VRDRPSAVEPSERYVDANELAMYMGVSLSTVKRWVRDGMPSETWGMSRTRRYLPSQCIEWARSRCTIDSLSGERNPPEQTQSKE
jgi:phage terminase Nu1 subunit (DNA packaging protein)